MTLSDLPVALGAIVRRFARPADANHAKLLAHLERWAHGEDQAASIAAWNDLTQRVLTQTHWMRFLFPDLTRENPDLLPVIRQLADLDAAPPDLREEVEAARLAWTTEQSSLDDRDSLVSRLLRELGADDPAASGAFVFLSRYYTFVDLLVATYVDARLRALHERVFTTLYLQSNNWPLAYCNGYLYQGWERLGLSGIKPTAARLAGYGIEGLLRPGAHVLDVGANSGMLAVALAEHVAQVDAIELNPFLVEIGRQVAAYAGRDNVRFEVADVCAWQPARRYDAVFSLANHCTIDGRMAMTFESYIAKLFALLEPGGWLFFESHNAFGQGTGAPGDDGDLDAKMEIAGRYFEVVATRMTRAFTPAHDIDKLFIALRRRPAYAASARTAFSLERARRDYGEGVLVAASAGAIPERAASPAPMPL